MSNGPHILIRQARTWLANYYDGTGSSNEAFLTSAANLLPRMADALATLSSYPPPLMGADKPGAVVPSVPSPMQVAAAPGNSSEDGGWRNIDSAPKDGSTVLLFRRCHGWNVHGYGHWVDIAGIEGWLPHGFSDPPGELGLGTPTHWQPLPDPPSSGLPNSRHSGASAGAVGSFSLPAAPATDSDEDCHGT